MASTSGSMTRCCSYKHRLPKMLCKLGSVSLSASKIFNFHINICISKDIMLLLSLTVWYMTLNLFTWHEPAPTFNNMPMLNLSVMLLPVWSHERDVKLTPYVSWRHIQCVHLPRMFGLSDCASAIWSQSEMGHAEQQPHFHPITGVAGGIEAPTLLICPDWGWRRWVSLAIKDGGEGWRNVRWHPCLSGTWGAAVIKDEGKGELRMLRFPDWERSLGFELQ